jgi:hypothetical protein
MSPDQNYHSASVAVFVPFLRSLFTGFVLGLCAWVLSSAFHWPNPPTLAGVVFVLGLAGTWIQAQRRWVEITRPEGLPLEPEIRGAGREDPQVLVRLTSEVDGYHETRAILPATLAQMQDLAAGLLDGKPFAERSWTGSDRPFSTNDFRALRSELVKRGLLVPSSPKDPRRGYALNCAGRQLMRAFLADDPSPIESREEL